MYVCFVVIGSGNGESLAQIPSHDGGEVAALGILKNSEKI